MSKDTCSHSRNCAWRAAEVLRQAGRKIAPYHLCLAISDAGEPCGQRAKVALGRDEETDGMRYGVPLCERHASGVVNGVRKHLALAGQMKGSKPAPKKKRDLSAKERWIEKNDHVYFARRGEVVKVGHSTQPEKRLRLLETQSGLALDEVVLTLGGRALEQRYHRRFADHRDKGEWFTMCPEIRDEMDRLIAESESEAA